MDLLPEHLRNNEPAKYIAEMAHSERRKQIACKHAAEQRLHSCEECLVRLQEELLAVDRDHQDVEHSISILRTLFIQAANDPQDVEHSIGILRTLFIQAANDPQDGRMQSLEVSRQMPPVHSNPVA